MNRTGTSHGGKSVALWGVLILVALTSALAWGFWPRPVKLSEESYEIAIALYRVCNQQDTDGLANLQERLDGGIGRQTIGEAEAVMLQEVMDEARAGNWEFAMKTTRASLDDQTQVAK